MTQWRFAAALVGVAFANKNDGGFMPRHLGGVKDLSYYTRENCAALGLVPRWSDPNYTPVTYFEKIFKSPLAIDLMASAHSANVTGFEQVTADWGCDFDGCYGEDCQVEGFYGPGAKDPAGGGCPRGPVRVYEDLACAIQLGLGDDSEAFTNFCGGSGDMKEGTFECLAFFANVIAETGAFSQMEERDPRPYCWDRSGAAGSDCCPAADHQACLPDSDQELQASDYPVPSSRWLSDDDADNKCCSYHGRGPLQVSYEPNYKSLSKDMLGDETVLLNHPYKLDADGVAGWTAALWFWFNKHPAQVGDKTNPDNLINVAPRDRVVAWKDGGGLPGAINIINGAECTGDMDTKRAFNRVSYFFAIAHRLNAVAPGSSLDHYALPGTDECSNDAFCSTQFMNSQSECLVFQAGVDCSNAPYVANVSTPMGFNRVTLKMTQINGESPVCMSGSGSSSVPEVWTEPQADFTPIPEWENMLDIHAENVCNFIQLQYEDAQGNICTGKSDNCRKVCWNTQSAWGSGEDCDEGQYQKPCQAMVEYLTHPVPTTNWESGAWGEDSYHGGIFRGRVGPGLVMAMNGAWGLQDRKDRTCFWFGGTECHWNIAMGDHFPESEDPHNCRITPPGTTDAVTDWTDPEFAEEETFPQLEIGQFPEKLEKIITYWDRKNCPAKTGTTVLEMLFPNGAQDFDMMFSAHTSPSDGFDNAYFDDFGLKNTNLNQLGLGAKGPFVVWDELLCAIQIGIPSDPDYFKKRFMLQNDDSIPTGSLSDSQKRFAAFEFAAFFANVLKETGNLGQAEERDPRSYCNHQGGSPNPCCPNDYGNNARCWTAAGPDDTTITEEEFSRSRGQNATCCSYHGRGYLQVSYEKNYGDIGAVMLKSDEAGIDEDFGRHLAVNFPQFIDAFGVMGWVSSLLYWHTDRPCQYCQGRNETTLDWNAPTASPHKACQDYDVKGAGLGQTFTIINGQECEAAFTTEADVSQIESAKRLAYFYNLVYRTNVGPPGESSSYYPLPGTSECKNSDWCQGTFGAADPPLASYRPYGGGCWALTPQPATDNSGDMYHPYCKPYVIQGGTKMGSRLETVTFTMYKPGNTCETLNEVHCGIKRISPGSEPSMTSDPQLSLFTKYKYPALDHDDPNFAAYAGYTAEELCRYTQTGPTATAKPPQSCMWWCQQPAGGLTCSSRDEQTCFVAARGLPFVRCVNKRFETDLSSLAGGCFIPEMEAPFPPPADPDFPVEGDCGSGCSSCVGASGDSWDDDNCAKCANGQFPEDWPCQTPGLCTCRN